MRKPFDVIMLFRRKEQSIDQPGQEKNHFDITYDISMTFDRNMDEMTGKLCVDVLSIG